MPAAVTFIGVQLGGTIGAALIMNSVVVANLIYFTVGPAFGPALRRPALRAQPGEIA